MTTLLVTGFDSAWGGTQRGALCDIWLDRSTLEMEIRDSPSAVTWSDAVNRVQRYSEQDHHLLAIDQGLIVPNQQGMRPVEKLLAKALGGMQCSAYPSNRNNLSCYGPNAGIWSFQRALSNNGYRHEPMSIPNSVGGRYYFECYPHPAIIALLNLKRVLKYKCRHRNQDDWLKLVRFLKALPVNDMAAIVDSLSEQTKANEDKLDSILCAYTGVLWWQYGTEKSSMLGDLTGGYVVTPHSETILRRFQAAFAGHMNVNNGTPGALPQAGAQGTEGQANALIGQVCDMQVVPGVEEWCGHVQLVATDTTNLWRNMKPAKGKKKVIINAWMDEQKFAHYRLVVKLLEEDAEPEVAFLPFSDGVRQQGIMPDGKGQPGVWYLLVNGAGKENPLKFKIQYRYERLD